MKEDFMGDEQLQMLRQKFEIRPPMLNCRQNHPIVTICINGKCKWNALFCEVQDCACCSHHETCESVKLKVITKLLQGIASEERQFLMRLYEIQDLAIKDIQNMRRNQIERHRFGRIEGKFANIIDQIFIKETTLPLDGLLASQFLQALKENKHQAQLNTTKILDEFSKQMQAIVQHINRLKLQMIQQLSAAWNQNEIPKEPINLEHFHPKKQKLKEVGDKADEIAKLFSSSKIISSKDIETIKFIHQNILQPTSLQLLFRASEHGFSSKAFHKACDNHQFTLTLYQTEFGNRMAGFTPIPWNAGVGWVTDTTMSSFILSIDLKERMQLAEPDKAVFCHQTWGPCFGDDITISDACDKNLASETNFPYSYRSKKKELAHSTQKSWKALCGPKKGNKFIVAEYEVYAIVW